MKPLYRAVAALLACIAVAAFQSPALAQQLRPLPQKVLGRGFVIPVRPPQPRRAARNIFGTIVALPRTGTTFVLRTRRGALLSVDARVAVASGQFSAPLFVGKIVLVNGDFDARRLLHARSVTRIEQLNAATPADS